MKHSRIMRVETGVYNRIKDLKEKSTFSDYLTMMLDLTEAYLNNPEYYLVEDRTYTDLAEARGQSLLKAVKANKPPELPKILLLVGEDTGNDRK